MNKYIYTIALLALTTCCGFKSEAQQSSYYNQAQDFLKGNSIWAFSRFGGLDFNTGSPIPIFTDLPDNGLAEGVASVCDPVTGDLLFYTNGETIWNANHMPMSNGTGLFGNGDALSTRQGALIVPFPGDENKYYVFSLNNVDQTNTGVTQSFLNNGGDTVRGSLFYSVVNMDLAAGQGEVVSNQKNILLDSTLLGEVMIAIPGTCENIWVLVHSAGEPLLASSPQYKAYEVTAAGVNLTPVVSSGKVNSLRGWLCVSPDRKLVALTGGGQSFDLSGASVGTGLEVARFDIQTGQVSDVVVIEDFDAITAFPAVTQSSLSCAFSPDGKKLYYHLSNAFDSSRLIQCDVSILDSQAIAVSKNQIAAEAVAGATILRIQGGFRLHNDTIYMSGVGSNLVPINYISRINAPNNQGLNCDYEPDAIALLPGQVPKGMTLGSETIFFPQSDTIVSSIEKLVCKGWSEGVQLSPEHSGGQYFRWNTGSTDSILVIDQGGDFWVSYYVEGCNVLHLDTFHITEGDMAEPTIQVNGFELRTALAYSTYQWLFNGAVINGANSRDYIVEENGDYQVIVSNPDGCVDTSDIYTVENVGIRGLTKAEEIKVYPNPTYDGMVTVITKRASINLELLSPIGKRMRTSNSKSISLKGMNSGIYLLMVKDTDGQTLKVEKVMYLNQ